MEQSLKLLISIKESARALGLSERTIWNLIGQGSLPVVRIGKRTLVKCQGLLRLADKGARITK